jgi:hypothetical protein
MVVANSGFRDVTPFRDVKPFHDFTCLSDARLKKQRLFYFLLLEFASLLVELSELMSFNRKMISVQAEKRDLFEAFGTAGSEIIALQTRVSELELTIQALKACPAFGYIAELAPTMVMSNSLVEREERAKLGQLAVDKAHQEYCFNQNLMKDYRLKKKLMRWVNDYQI